MQNKPHEEKNKKCGAKTRKGTPCKNPAGFRTNHVGKGRCYLHGGLSTGPKDINKLKTNKNAEKHGFFSKYLPKETMDIIQEINEKDPLDILWENIQIQYAAIIRAQKIMYVEDIYDTSNEVSMQSSGEGGSTTAYAVQYAWDKQATFLKAQSRAMSELRNLIKQYDEMLTANKDMVTEEQKLRIEKLKVDIEKVKDKNNDQPIEIFIKRKDEE